MNEPNKRIVLLPDGPEVEFEALQAGDEFVAYDHRGVELYTACRVDRLCFTGGRDSAVMVTPLPGYA